MNKFNKNIVWMCASNKNKCIKYKYYVWYDMNKWKNCMITHMIQTWDQCNVEIDRLNNGRVCWVWYDCFLFRNLYNTVRPMVNLLIVSNK